MSWNYNSYDNDLHFVYTPSFPVYMFFTRSRWLRRNYRALLPLLCACLTLVIFVQHNRTTNDGYNGLLTQSPTTEKPQVENAFVVAAMKKDSTSWLYDYFHEWHIYVYVVDDQSAPLTVPRNKGRESMVYLTFIIENYDHLPANILFLHPDRYQWHNDDPEYDGLPMLRSFQLSYLEKEGYVNLRCVWIIGCPGEIKPFTAKPPKRGEVPHAGYVYQQSFKELFPDKEVPETVGASCCAQFAVTREKVLQRPKREYERFREWLLVTELEDSLSGRIFEYSWHIIFGKEPVHCPSAKECYCNVFGLCDLECRNDSCAGRYTLPPYSIMPKGWPELGWDGKRRIIDSG